MIREYQITVTSKCRRTYYVEAESWEEAEDTVDYLAKRTPYEEEFLRDEIDVECVE